MVQFLKWVIRFQVFSHHILAGVYHFLVADLFSYPWFMPAAPQLLDGCNILWVCIDLASWYAWRNVNSAFIWHLFKVELVLHLRLNHTVLIQRWVSVEISMLIQWLNVNVESTFVCQHWINVCMSAFIQVSNSNIFSTLFQHILSTLNQHQQTRAPWDLTIRILVIQYNLISYS